MVKIKIGGDDGTSTYTVLRGQPTNTLVKGWEMKIEIDGSSGTVSGSNKNEGSKAKKTYSKFFIGIIIDDDVDKKANYFLKFI